VSRTSIYRLIFALAGLYNIAFGSWAALFPRAAFDLLDLGEPSHPEIWACLGMVVGLYGLLYLQVAFTDPAHRHSVVSFGKMRIEYDFTRFVIALGLAGKILGPIGLVLAVGQGRFSIRLLSLLVFNDLIWWAAFTWYLIDDSAFARLVERHVPRICAVAHAVTALATLFFIRGGSEAIADPMQRATYIASHVATWRVAWFLWMIAAITLVSFYCWWAARLAHQTLALVALCISFAGLAADFFADALFIAWMPDRYAAVARPTTFVSEVVANGLYSIAGAMLMRATPDLPVNFRMWGWLVWTAGLMLAVCGAIRWDGGIVAASAALLALFTPWVWVANQAIDEPT
jgi:hypothetical protein